MKSGQLDLNCLFCKREGREMLDTQKHIFYCPVLMRQNNIAPVWNIQYEDIFTNNIQRISTVEYILRTNYETRKKFLEDK